MESLEIQHILTRDGDKIIFLLGNFTALNAMDHRPLIFQNIKESDRNCVIDVSKVSKMDAGALNVLVQAHRMMEKNKKELHIRVKDNIVCRNIFRITRMDKYLSIEP